MSTISLSRARAGAALALLALSTATACSSQPPSTDPSQRLFYFTPAPGSATAAPPPQAPAPQPAPANAGYKGLGVESLSPEVLAKYAPKPVEPELSRRIQALLDVRAPGAGLVSPDGKRMYFTWSVTGTQQIWRLDGPMRFPVQLTGGEDTTSIAALTPDGKTLIVSRDRSGEENPGLYLLSTSGGAMQLVQHEKGVQTFLQHVADDGRSILFRANDRTKDAYAIYRYELGSKSKTLVFGEPGLWEVADVRGKSGAETILLVKNVGSNMTELYEYEVANKKLTPLFGQGEREDYVAAYGPGDEVLVLTPKLGEFRRLYQWKRGQAADAKGLVPISPELSHDVSDFAVDHAKKRVVYTVNEAGYTKLFAVDAKTKKPLTLPKLPQADHVRFGATSRDGRYLSISVDPGTAPAQAYVFDWNTTALTRWHEPAAPEVDLSKVPRASLQSYPARDGTKIPVFVRRPAECEKPAEPCPVIVHFHGGPESQTVAGFNLRSQLFVGAGFVFVEPNVRGSDGYGKTWIHADDGPKRAQILTDIEDAAKWARSSFTVGGKQPRVGVYGGSYGGYSTFVAMTMFPGAYDVGVSVVGISSLVSFLENTAPYRRALRESEYGSLEKDRAALEAMSPINHLDKLRAPLLILQGATDPRVPVGESLQFHEAAVAKNIPSELVIYADEGHGFRKRPNQVSSMGYTLRFFEKHLGGSAAK